VPGGSVGRQFREDRDGRGTYVEFFQPLDRRIAIPIAVTGIGGTELK
jgi:hypothetical protein